MTAPLPKAGDLLLLTRAASVQFVRPVRFRMIRVLDRPTYDGWIWLDGYRLDARDEAVARRTVFVQPAGLVAIPRTAPTPARRSGPTPPGVSTRARVSSPPRSGSRTGRAAGPGTPGAGPPPRS
ncbi:MULTISPECIES: hypothetical protein [unclassified Micromonospora]|uniref:hypothetical protein n=1 Tax=unclassified Micromonospora TaxID=2617518 RepID=UPI001E2D5D4B|nr:MULTISPECIES: hypothetical protein [unclassified Micromonospora]